jgi:serine/threonine protein phosphatase 1
VGCVRSDWIDYTGHGVRAEGRAPPEVRTEMRPRTIAIGDVHGCAVALDSLLRAIAPRPDDVIVTLGDYVNRGPDSRGVLDRLITLERECRLIPILGNHDEMLRGLLELARLGHSPSLNSWLEMGGDSTLMSYGARRGSIVPGDLARIPAEHFEFLLRCRDYHETASHLFVHAQYDPSLALDEQPPEILRWESLRNITPGPHVSGKRAVFGHTSQKGGEVLNLGHLVCIDTYCYGGGWLTALDVDTDEYWQVDRLGQPRESAR